MTKIFNIHLLALLYIIALPVQAASDVLELSKLSLAELINVRVISSFFAKKPSLSPGTQYVLDFEDIERYAPARTLGDALEDLAAGITVSKHVNHGQLIGVRGFMIDNNAKTPVMWDGQNLSQRQHFGYTIGLESPLIGDMRTAEISLSPNTIVLGGGAINGYINLIPKNGTDNAGTFVRAEYGPVEELYSAEIGHGFNYGTDRDLYTLCRVSRCRGLHTQFLAR